MSDNNEYNRNRPIGKHILLVTGPQGSGNHLFSKILGLSEHVYGWDFGEKYWIPSDEEPFAECWVNPELTVPTLEKIKEDYVVANVSVPFVFDGEKRIPAIQEFVDEAKSAGHRVTVCIVSRDRNINCLQQERVRDEITLPTAMAYYRCLDCDFAFLSHETLYLHKGMYLKYLSRTLGFPIDYDNPRVYDILVEDQNNKYVKYVEEHWLDNEVWKGLRPKSERK
jgi:hypothetical protein